jgi:hypothetical protein
MIARIPATASLPTIEPKLLGSSEMQYEGMQGSSEETGTVGFALSLAMLSLRTKCVAAV